MDKYNPLDPKLLDYPRVSHIKGILRSSGLEAFGSFQLGRFYIYKLFHMIPILLPFGFNKEVHDDDDVAWKAIEDTIKKCFVVCPEKFDHPANFTTKAFSIGTHVHKLAERLFTNQGFDELSLEDQDCVAELKDITTGWTPVAVEKPLCSIEHKFRGTCDLIAVIDGRLTLVDVKTGKSRNGVYNEYDLQLAAYKLMFEEQTGKEILDCAILLFCKEKKSWSLHFRKIHEGHKQTFLGARESYEWHRASNAKTKDEYVKYMELFEEN